jgi:hypothetical protein
MFSSSTLSKGYHHDHHWQQPHVVHKHHHHHHHQNQPSSSTTLPNQESFEAESLKQGEIEAVRKTVSFQPGMDGKNLRVPTPDAGVAPKQMRNRSASIAWVDFLTAPTDSSPFSTSDDDSDVESTIGKPAGPS